MAGRIIAKPKFDSGGGGFLFPTQGQYQIKDKNGNIAEQGFAGGQMGENGIKVQSHLLSSGQIGNGYSLSFNGQDYNFNGDPGQRFEFDVGKSDPALVGDKGAYGSTGNNGVAGVDGMPISGVSGGGSSGVAALPFYLGGFPKFKPINYDPVGFNKTETADFKFTDPTKFGQEFGKNNSSQVASNFDTAGDFAATALQNELKGLKDFVPGAANLQRGEVAADNASNQAARTSQVDAVLPNARKTFASLRGTLEGQAGRAATYASGRLPDSFADRALELGTRGAAADNATFGGFGSRSGQAAKTSDLMSAEERFKVAQYGEGLSSQNTQQQQQLVSNEAALELAPTEYSNAGSQVKVTPEVGAGRLTYQGADMLNSATVINPGQALQSTVQQNQFATQLETNNRQFNAEGTFRADQLNSQTEFAKDQFNASNIFTGALGAFNYNAGYLAQLQGANQTNLNAALGVGVAGINAGTYNAGMNQAQTGNTITATGGAIGTIGGAVQGFANLFTDNTKAPTGTGTGVTTSGGTEVPAASPVSTGNSLSGKSAEPLSTDASVPGSYRFGPNQSLPQGFTAVAQNSDGTTTAVKTETANADISRFAKFTGDTSIPDATINHATAAATRSLANSAGLSFTPQPGFKKIGMTAAGGDIYSLPSVASNGDARMGQDNLLNVGHMLASLGSTDAGMLNTIHELAQVAGDPRTHTAIDVAHQTGLADGAAHAISQAIASVVGPIDPKTPAGAQITAGAMAAGQSWGNLSPAQKSMALMSLAGPAIQQKTGRTVGSEKVGGTEKSVLGGLTAGQVMSFTQNGANGYSLARNWNDHAAIGEMIGASGSPERAAQIAHGLGSAGYGPQGSSLPISGEYLKRTGAQPAPEFGIGALALGSVKTVPNGYKISTTTPDGKVIAIPQTHASTSSFGKGSIEPLAYKKTVAIAGGQHPAQAMWNEAPTKDVIRGSVGGSALVSTLDTMATKTPFLFAGVAAHSIFQNMMGE